MSQWHSLSMNHFFLARNMRVVEDPVCAHFLQHVAMEYPSISRKMCVVMHSTCVSYVSLWTNCVSIFGSADPNIYQSTFVAISIYTNQVLVWLRCQTSQRNVGRFNVPTAVLMQCNKYRSFLVWFLWWWFLLGVLFHSNHSTALYNLTLTQMYRKT